MTVIPQTPMTVSSTETGSPPFNAAGRRTGLNDARFQSSTRMTIVVTTPTRVLMGPSAIAMTVYPIATDSLLADLDGSSVLRSAKFRYLRTMKVEITPILTTTVCPQTPMVASSIARAPGSGDVV
jgi:hypothetical protein